MSFHPSPDEMTDWDFLDILESMAPTRVDRDSQARVQQEVAEHLQWQEWHLGEGPEDSEAQLSRIQLRSWPTALASILGKRRGPIDSPLPSKRVRMCSTNLEILDSANRDEETFKCPLCLEDCSKQDVFEIGDECGHVMCRVCAHQNFVMDLKSRRFPILCPMCRSESVETDVTPDKLMLILSPEEQRKYHSGTLNQFVVTNQNAHQCPVPNCVGIAWLDDDQLEFLCPVCKHRRCVKCETGWHKGKSCQQNLESRSEKKFAAVVKAQGWQKCPQCKATVEKTRGCNHMRSHCGKEFCYACGGNYPRCKCLPNRMR